jgi:hypothetical protein
VFAGKLTPSSFVAALGAYVPVGATLVLYGLAPNSKEQRPRRRLYMRTPAGWFIDDPRPMHRPRALITVNPHSIEAKPQPLGFTVFVVDDDARPQTAAGVVMLGLQHVRPSIVVASGRPGHRHLYFLLNRLVPVEEGEPIARRLCDFMNADPNYSATHMVPPPAPANLNPKTGTAVTLMELDVRRRHSPEMIDSALTAAGARPLSVFQAAADAHRERQRRGPDDTAAWIHPESADPARSAWLLAALGPEGRLRIARGATDGWLKGDRSIASMIMIGRLLTVGASHDEIAAIWLSNPEGIGNKVAERGLGHLENQISAVEDRRFRRHYISGEHEHVHVLSSFDDRLELEVEIGSHRGARWLQYVARGSSVVPHVRAAFGLAPGESIRNACGRRAWVVLHASGTKVKDWIAPESSEVTE